METRTTHWSENLKTKIWVILDTITPVFTFRMMMMTTVLNLYVLLTSIRKQLHSLQAAVEMKILKLNRNHFTHVGIAMSVVHPVCSMIAIGDEYLSVPALVLMYQN